MHNVEMPRANAAAEQHRQEKHRMSDQGFKAAMPSVALEDAESLAALQAKRARQRAAAAAASASPPTPASPEAVVRQANARPDRVGKVMIAGYFPAATSKALKHIAVDEGLTLQQVMANAFTMYLKSKRPAE